MMMTAPALLRRPVLLVVLLMASGCHGSSATWNGTWRLNPAKSRVQGGADIAVITSPDGQIRITNDAFNFDFRCNGKEYSNPNGKDLTTSCIQVGTAQWKLTYKRNGAVSSEVLWDLSPDATTLTIHGKSIQPDRSSRDVEHVYHRLGEGSGLSGRWQEGNPFSSRPPLLNLSLEGSTLHFAYPETGQYVDAPLDGTRTPMHTSPRARQGFAMSIKQASPVQMHTEISFEGRVIREGTLTISNDGRTIIQESWAPERLSEKDSFVYEKQ
jgi:hypothetical protein